MHSLTSCAAKMAAKKKKGKKDGRIGAGTGQQAVKGDDLNDANGADATIASESTERTPVPPAALPAAVSFPATTAPASAASNR